MESLLARWKDTLNSGPKSRDNSFDKSRLNSSLQKSKSTYK
jgi:hypothetical protein